MIHCQFYYSLMLNPQSQSAQLSPRTIYSYDNHTNLPWNITEYQVPALHNDYKKIMRDKMYASQKKGVKVNDFYVTKRGFYMDYQLKVAKSIPSSTVHGKQEPWPHEETLLEAEALKTARESKKFTYLERIEMQQTARPVPGVSTYKLQKSQEQLQQARQKSKKELSYGEKRYFYEDTHFLSERVPGPGNYNPHESVQKFKKSIGDWQFWTKKHNKLSQVVNKRQSKIPAPGSYSPIYRSYSSFEELQTKDKRQKQIKNGFGSDARFPYLRPNRKQIIEKRPAPSSYQTKINWKGKTESPKKKEWIKMLWKGSPPKVYS